MFNADPLHDPLHGAITGWQNDLQKCDNMGAIYSAFQHCICIAVFVCMKLCTNLSTKKEKNILTLVSTFRLLQSLPFWSLL